MSDTTNKRIAKNTLLLYVRLAFATIVSLYTSRVVLLALGVDDFGIYGVVGGIITLFTFVNGSMAGATSRFLTYELGLGNTNQLRDTFATAFLLHCAIALVIVLVAETVGLWFLTHKLVIPPERMDAAMVLYQLSIFATVLSITQVPYNASIISHEKMHVYAYTEILCSVLKLGIAYSLASCPGDKLVVYGLLMFSLPIISTVIYRTYCRRHFAECKLRFVWNQSILKPMLNFSGWDVYGNLSIVARTQGVNMLLNLFFGPAMNAAASIATRVQLAIISFSINLLTASRPQIIKQYAQGNHAGMVSLLRNTLRLNFFLLQVACVPLLLEMDFVLDVWLNDVPANAVAFCKLTLLFCIFACMSSVIISGVHATGHIKRPSIINGTLYLSVVPVSYFLYKNGAAPWVAYLFNALAAFVGMLSNAYTLRIHVPQFSLRTLVVKDFLSCMAVFGVGYAVGYALHENMEEGWVRFLLVCAATSILSTGVSYVALFPASLREKIILSIRKLLRIGN